MMLKQEAYLAPMFEIVEFESEELLTQSGDNDKSWGFWDTAANGLE